MTKDVYDKSIEAGELQLTGFSEKMSHFGLVGFSLFFSLTVPFFVLMDFFNGRPITVPSGITWIAIVSVVLSTIVYLIQKRRLKFRIVETSLGHDQLLKIVDSVAETLKWEFVSKTDNVILAVTNPSALSGSWGEQITILFYQDRVFVNSICDLHKKQSVVSWGRNRENETTLINTIAKANQQSKV